MSDHDASADTAGRGIGDDELIKRATARGLRVLAAREYSRSELTRKLTRQGVSAEQAAVVVERLATSALQSDARFVESFVHSRIERGYGPVWIRQALLERGIASADVSTALDQPRAFWVEQGRRVLRKRFGPDSVPDDRSAWARMARFIAQRGFPADVVAAALAGADDSD